MLQNFINKDIEIFTSKERPFSLVSKTVRHLVLALLEVVKKPCQRQQTKKPTERKYILSVGFFLSISHVFAYNMWGFWAADQIPHVFVHNMG
jgi:hypothetical protein